MRQNPNPYPIARFLTTWMAWCAVTITWATEPPPADFVSARILPLLADQCWSCHGEKKQRGGLRLDSHEAVLRGGHGLVVDAADVQRSRLLIAVRYENDDEDKRMPPDQKLSDAQIADLTTWVAMGVPYTDVPVNATPAPVVIQTIRAFPSSAVPSSTVIASAVPSAQPSSSTAWSRWWRFIGHLHPVVVHFPIALILAAAFAEAWSMWLLRRGVIEQGRSFSQAGYYALGLGTVTATIAVGLGWIAASDGDYAGESANYLFIHRWLGMAATAIALVVMAVGWQGKRQGWYRWLLFIVAVLIGIVGHFGGSLTHGIAYLTPPW